jgi:hypothetical protein
VFAADGFAVAQDRDAVGDSENFVHAMRDVNDRHARIAQAFDHREQLRNLLGV